MGIPTALKVLLISDEPASTAIWRALNGLRPAVTVATCLLAQAGNYPGYPVLVVSHRQWQALSPQAQARLAHSLELACLYAAPRGQGGSETQALITLSFADTPNLAENIAQALAEAAKGAPLGTLSAVRLGAAWSTQPDYAWKPLPPAQPASTPPPQQPARQPTQAAPASPSASGGIHIGVINVAGDVYQGNRVEIKGGNQPVTLNLNGPAQVSQHSAGDQVNITQTGGSGESAGAPAGKVTIDQQAGKDQVNINDFKTGANAAVKQNAGGYQMNINTVEESGSPTSSKPSFCNHCGATIETEKRFCNQCGHPVEGA